MKLAEALAPELPPEKAEAVMDEYMDLYNRFYLENMRKKLGLLKKDEPEDEILIIELLQTMHNTGRMSAVKHCLKMKSESFLVAFVKLIDQFNLYLLF